MRTRFVTLLTLLFVALTLAQVSPTGVVAAIATVAVVTALAVRFGALVVGSREMTVGARAHAHRESLTGMPSPQHPSTAGRPRTRAPSQGALAA